MLGKKSVTLMKPPEIYICFLQDLVSSYLSHSFLLHDAKFRRLLNKKMKLIQIDNDYRLLKNNFQI